MIESDVIERDVADDEPDLVQDRPRRIEELRVTPTESAPPPVPPRAPRITVFSRDDLNTLAAVVAWDGARWRALAVVEGPNTNLAEDLLSLHGALGRALRDGSKPPRDVAFLWSAVTAAVVDVPTAGLPADRLEALLGWELEPFLPGEGEAHDTPGAHAGTALVACGWAQAAGPGPLLACGVRPGVRDELREAVGRAGLRLRGLYPLLGCAVAEMERGSAGARVVLELAAGSVAATRVEGDRVTRARLSKCPPGAEAGTAVGLVPEDAGLVLATPLRPELPDLLGVEAQLLSGAVEAPLLPSGVLGAARHALGLPGGERVACVPPQPRRKPIRLGRAQVAFGAALLAMILLAVGAELGYARAIADRTARLQALGPAGSAAAKRRLETRLAQARARLALQGEVQARRQLPELLRAVAGATPEELMVERLHEEPTGALLVEGAALSELAVRRFARDLDLLLKPLGLQVGTPEVRRRDQQGRATPPAWSEEDDLRMAGPAAHTQGPVSVYTFTLRCQRVPGAAR